LDDQQQQQKERNAKPLRTAAAAKPPQPQPPPGDAAAQEEPAGGQQALMAQVVELQAAEIRQLREANAELELRLALRKESHRAAARRVAELEHHLLRSEQEAAALRAQIEHEHEHQRRKRRKIADVVESPGEQQPGAEANADASPSSVRSFASSPPPPLPPTTCGGGVLGEARSLMPFLRDYDIRSSLAVVDFRFVVCDVRVSSVCRVSCVSCVSCACVECCG
jgi:hypothetical protein